MENTGNNMATGNTPQAAKTPGTGEDDLSMEEILQSIRRIIAEDDADVKKAPANDANAAADSSVLELTDMVKDDGTVVSLKAEEKPVEDAKEAAPADILSTIDKALTPEKSEEKPVEKPAAKAAAASQDDIDAMFAATPPAAAPAPVAPPAPQPAPAAAKPAAAPATPTDSLLSAEASSAATSAIKKLKSAEPEPPPLVTTPSAHFRSGNTVEDMVTDMLRPMMKSWLDANLPQIVERIVEREVKKLTKYLSDKGD